MEKTPRQYAKELMVLSDEYSKLSALYADCIKDQAKFFHENRDKHKSDNATQKAFELTERGIVMTVAKLKLKSKEKEMSSIKTMLRLLETEAKNQF